MRTKSTKFGLRYSSHPVPKKVKFIGRLVKIVLKSFAGTSAILSHEYATISFIAADQIVDELINFFGEEEVIS